MKIEKFESEIMTLKKFFELYCKNKHENIKEKDIDINYKGEVFSFQLNLCEDCIKTISYSFKRLQECPHEEKPRCRNCKNPCYEKLMWKKLASIMKYSAIKLSLSKAKQRVKKLFTS